jgi:hypothetical protein
MISWKSLGKPTPRLRSLRRLYRDARPLTADEILVIHHLVRPMIEQRHYSMHLYAYHLPPWVYPPRCWLRFLRPLPETRYARARSLEISRQAPRWLDSLAARQVYVDRCRSCPAPCFDYAR